MGLPSLLPTLRIQQGVHPKVVQERLGHSDISLTLKTYSHVMPGMQEEVAGKLEELLSPIDVSDDLRKLVERLIHKLRKFADIWVTVK
jgi:hypothetical protein